MLGRKSAVSICTALFSVFAPSAYTIEFSGIYSCNSKSDDKPITYVFNNRLMVRDNEKEVPYEFLSGLTSGELIYAGRALHPKIHGVVDLKFWSMIPSMPEETHINNNPETKEEYVLGLALSCHFRTNLLTGSGFATDSTRAWANYLDKVDPTGIEVPIATLTCADAKKYTTDAGIKDIEQYFYQRNKSNAVKNPNLFQTKLVLINVKKATIWETAVKNLDIATTAPITRKCSVIQMAVPEIAAPDESIRERGI